MIHRLLAALVLVLCAFALPARAIDQAKPGESTTQAPAHAQEDANDERVQAALYAAQDRTAFERDIKLDQFRLLAIQHRDQIKILDSWARQSLRTIRHRDSIDGKDTLYIALDMAFRPEAWFDKNFIYVESVPIREELMKFASDPKEAERIRTDALVSPNFLGQDRVQSRLKDIAIDSRQLEAVNKVQFAFRTFLYLGALERLGDSMAIVPPAPSASGSPWSNPDVITQALIQSVPPAASGPAGASRPAPMPPAPGSASALLPYTLEQQRTIALGFHSLIAAWQENDAATANKLGIEPLVALLPTINPAAYPTHTKAVVELWYNRTFSGTLVAFIYFAAMVLFFIVAVGITPRLGKAYKIAISIYSFALVCHLTAMGVRWWINGRIPIQNQFESVMGSAATGCFIGLILEWRKKSGIFGTAFGFVGFLSSTALLAAPYVFGQDLGAAPAKVAGILNTYWLYIHVNIVIASYALIGASFMVASIFLLSRLWHWINPVEPGSENPSDAAFPPESSPAKLAKSSGATVVNPQAALQSSAILAQRATYLDTLDQANMVILQMAFWSLGVGIMCGAVWADQSWGRPWGWDPKETFALVTWMVYLVIVHVRLVIKQKSDTTSWLSLAGFAIMMFNWIGVNFWLKGLHSYA